MNSITSRSKPISNLLKPTSKTLYISLFSTSSSSPSPTPPNLTPLSSSSQRRCDEESKSVRVSVWWDIENCGVPNGANVVKIAHSITNAVRLNGIKGPLQITAFGDVFRLNRANQEALSNTGVTLVHVPNGGKNSTDRSLLMELMYWVSQNPPPAHIFLISGDRDFAGILHKLRMSNYNILLAAREPEETQPGVLYSAASIMWHWNELSKGENLSGKHFNQPPDGPFNSWYGHYKGPLEDPFAVYNQQKQSESDDSSKAELSSDITIFRPVPMAVLKQLWRVINSHREGLTIREFRDQLLKGKVRIDKDFYGYKKLSRFLEAFPHIIKIESCPDGQILLLPAKNAIPKAAEFNDISAKANSETPVITRMVNVDGKEKTEEEKITRKTSEKVSDASLTENGMASIRDPIGKNAANDEIVESVMNTSEYISKQKDGKIGDDVRDRLSTSRPASQEKPISEDSSPNTALNLVVRVDTMVKSESSPGFIGKIINWCNSWRNESSNDRLKLQGKESSSAEEHTEKVNVVSYSKFQGKESSYAEEDTRKFDDVPRSMLKGEESNSTEEDARKLDDVSCSKLEDNASHSRKHELFTKDSFWNALRSFFKTHRGSNIVLNSVSRQQLAERLKKEGPLFLRPLLVADISNLVDLLISERKWIKELSSENPRFKIVDLSSESSAPTQHHNPTGLSSIFSNPPTCENSQLKVLSIEPQKPAEKYRSEILVDCQKLLDETLSQNPAGFNIGLFKKKFLEKYGYALDHQKLGYPKLVSLLQMMPGVKVESSVVLPDSVVYAPGIQSFVATKKSKGSDSESPWEELGPVSKSTLGKDEVNGVYEPSVSDDDEFSELEGDEPSSSTVKAKEESPLLEILDSWYSGKEDKKQGEHASNPEDRPSSSEDESDLSSAPTVKNGGKKKAQKKYMFVAEPTETKDANSAQ